MFQLLKRCQQVRHRAAPAIQPPHQHHVDLAPARRFDDLLPQFPRRGAGAHLANLQDNGPTAPRGILPQGAHLQRNGLLVVCGDAGV
jgi:hypothetical protein